MTRYLHLRTGRLCLDAVTRGDLDQLQGRGFAAETVTAALAAAADLRPDLPVVASLFEHNRSSKVAAERAGLRPAWRGPDTGNPDVTAVRLIYADRPLTDDLIKILTRP